jgi:glycosyltransferase involved in cell wall biosynthesis
MSTKPTVVVVSPSPVPSFVRQDAEILSSSFDVETLAVAGLGLGSVGRVQAAIRRADAVLIWFLGRNALLSIILARSRNIPVVAVIGGFEVAWVKAFKHGVRPGSLKEGILRRMLAASDVIISVSHFSREEARKRFPKFGSKLMLIPNAVDTTHFHLGSRAHRTGVVSVGAINRGTIDYKSIRLYVETARRMPDISFTLIGSAVDLAAQEFVRSVPSNMQWLGEIRHDAISERLQAASVYFQASVYESFCVALAEAMSCGCFPVISNCTALPEVAGTAATVLRDLTPESAEIAIRTALGKPDSEREVARRRIVEHYGIGMRRELLCSTIQKVIDQSRAVKSTTDHE